MELEQNRIFILNKFVFSNMVVHQISEHLNQSKLMISGHFSNFMSILVLVEKLVRLFCSLCGLIMSLPTRTTSKTPDNSLYSF